MSKHERFSARTAGAIFGPVKFALGLCATALAAPASPSSPGVPEAKAFVESVRSGSLDPETYDFAAAGFFRLPRQERILWQVGVFQALGLPGQVNADPCMPLAQRDSAAVAWAQAAGQATDADEWRDTTHMLRARLQDLDQHVKQSAPDTPSADPGVQELLVRFARDQAVRSIFSQRKWTDGLSPAAASHWVNVAVTRMTAIDCDNTAWLKSQLVTIGWFTIPKYGKEADTAAWHLVQHADREPAFQREMLDKLRALPPGETDGARLGMLYDRVARASGRLQRYGTQGQCRDGRWTPFESEDPEHLDARRASIGLEPIAEHMEIASRNACPH